MSKRKIGLYVALFAIIIGGAPYFTGYLAQTKFQDVVKVASEFEPVTITILEYDRGWRKSYAKTLVTLKGRTLEKLVENIEKGAKPQPSNVKKGLEVVLEHEIRHGPFVQLRDGDYRHWRFALAAIHSKVFLTERAKKLLQSELGNDELVNINSVINIEGDVNTQVDGRVLSIKEPDGKEHVFWKGLNAQLRLSRDMKHFEGETMMPGFDFYWKGKHCFAEDLRFKSERFKSPEGLWLGKGTLSLQKMEMNDLPGSASPSSQAAEDKAWSLSMLTMGGVVDAEGGMVDSTTTLVAQEFEYNHKKWGPINIVFTLKNVEASVAQAYFKITQRMQMDPNPLPTMYLQSMIEHLPELLKSRPEFNIENLNIHTEQGDIKGVLSFAIGGANANDINNLQQILQSIASKANLMFPKALLQEILTKQYMKTAQTANLASVGLNQKAFTDEELQQQVAKQVEEAMDKQIQSGVLIERDHSYFMEIELFQGILKINGKPMEIPPSGVGIGGAASGVDTPSAPSVPLEPSSK